VDLPGDALQDNQIELTFIADDPRSPVGLGWSTDDRRLGVHIRTLTLERVDRSLRLGEKVEFCEGLGAERFLGDGWSGLEPTGVWTIEETARLAFRLTGTTLADVELVLELIPFVTPEHREVELEIWAGTEQLKTQTFRDGESEQAVHVDLPRDSIDSEGRAVLELRIRDPVRPVDLGMGSDPRRLGLYLRSLTVVEPGTYVPVADPAVRALGKLRNQLIRSLRG
jgi:hypothetical protein